MRFSRRLTFSTALCSLLATGIPAVSASTVRENKANSSIEMASLEGEGGSFKKAVSLLQESLLLHRELGKIDGEAAVLSQMGALLAKQNQPELAIIFYKQSINIIENIRSSLSELPPEFQRSYTGTVSDTYRSLADLLIQQDRIFEAQTVLDLLKVEELREYLGDVRGNPTTAVGVEYNELEKSILARYQQAEESAISLSQEYAELNSAFDARSPEEEKRREELKNLSEQLASLFIDFTNAPDVQALVAQLAVSEGESPPWLDSERLSRLQQKLASLEVALLYPLVLDDRIELVLITGVAKPLHRTIELEGGREELNQAVFAFQQSLRDPNSDAIAPAQQLYKWLFEAIEDDLETANIETVLYAPDGVLRYVPLAALHDGNQWIAQRFRINNITSESLDKIESQPLPQAEPRVFAGAFTDQSKVYSVGDKDYRGLRFAGEEIKLIAESTPLVKTFFDDSFSVEAVQSETSRSNILHFATHASFVSTDSDESFILFGDGQPQTVTQILENEGSKWDIGNIDLVVLSACETGLGGTGRDGRQILGLGYQFQVHGASAVIASLWQVSDSGTQVLMGEFYQQLSQGAHKNEALQNAQIALINSDLTVAEALRRRPEVLDLETGEPVIPSTGRISHPFYWAPFILIGNGL